MPPLAVTPVVVAPLALLALLFPALFAGPLAALRRWWAVLNVASVCTALYVARFTFAGFKRTLEGTGAWWADPAAFWLLLAACSALGAAWTFWRAPGPGATGVRGPARLDTVVLCLLSLAGLGLVVYRLFAGEGLVCPALVACTAAWAGAAYLLGVGRPARPRPPAQAVTLLALAAGCCGYAALTAAGLAA
jgi:hypothetical protein